MLLFSSGKQNLNIRLPLYALLKNRTILKVDPGVSGGFKSTLAQDFLFLFFFIKAPHWSPDSNPKFVSNIKLNSPRYLNYSAFCIDSVNVELLFASSYIQTFNIFWLILAPFEHFMFFSL